MGIVSYAMLIVSGAYLALGLMYLRFWWAERVRMGYLAFALGCSFYAVFAWLELGMSKSATPGEYLFNIWWAFIPGGLGMVAFAGFAYLHLNGRKWIFFTYAAMRILALVLHLFMTNGINFRQVTGVVARNVLGETLTYPIAVPNPWMLLPHLSHVVLIVFFLDASVRCWRRGERRQAWTFGTGTILFGIIVLAFSLAVLWGLVPIPIMSTFAVLFLITPMLYELNVDMHRAAMISETLAERDAQLTDTLEQLQLSAAAGNVGMWTRKAGEDEIWVNEKAAEIWGLPRGKSFTREELFQHIHPADRELFVLTSYDLEEGKNEFQMDYRTLSDDGEIRWIHSSGKVEVVDGTRTVRGAIVDITNLKLVEARLAETLEKLQLAASAGNVGMWTRTIDGELTWASEEAGEIWDFEPGEQITQSALLQRVHPSDRARFTILFKQLAAGRNDYQLEFRILLKDGNIRWILSRGKVEQLDGSRIIRGTIVDITKLRLAEEAISELSHKLVNAQEQERSRLARELHDDLNQSIALLTIQLAMLQNEPKDIPYVKDQLGKLVSDLQGLAKDVHRISHELHPGKLAQLGLETALSGFCRELSDTRDLEIDLVTHDLPENLPPEISLCLYRVTQESLKNVVKHSGATLAHVSLRSEGNEIRLAVRDDGNGFDTEAVKAKNGLGLISIDERVRHVEGTAQITSVVGEGTTIEVRIPLVAESSVLEADVIG